MSNKIKYNTERNGEFKEFPLNSTTLYLPNGEEFAISYCPVRQALQITKCWGEDSTMTINPGVSNVIYIK